MSVNIKTWGCGKTKESRHFKTNKEQKPVVVINQEVECRYSNIVPEGIEEEQEEEIEIVGMEEEEEQGDLLADNAEPEGESKEPSPEREEKRSDLKELREVFRRFL